METNEKLSEWFGLSYASWLTLPRVLIGEMPEEWQARLADLLHEYDDMFPASTFNYGTRVQITLKGKLVKTPEWLIQYRHPDFDAINKLKE